MIYSAVLETFLDYFYMNGKTIGIVLVVLIILAGGWYLLANQSGGTQTGTQSGNSQATTTGPSTGTSTVSTGTSIRPLVTYTNDGFSPATLTVAEGTTVTFVNQSSNPMWIASDPHPTHQGYDGTTRSTHCAPGYTGPTPFDECTTVSPGTSYTFTFTKTGSWGYHNHAGAEDHGTIVVTGGTGVSGSVNVTM